MPPLVVINVNQIIAPTANNLQQTGAFVSQGATTTAPGTLTQLTTLASLSAILKGSLPLSNLVWAGNIVTATAASVHGFTVGDTISLTIAGALPTAYNGTYVATVTTATQFTYALSVNPGTITAPGSYTPEDVAELAAMNATFFAQAVTVPINVLELGPGNANDGVAALTTWLTNNPQTVYSFLVPRYWDGNANFLALIADYEAPSMMTYFFVTTTTGTYATYTSIMKDLNATVEAPGIPSTEFSAAAKQFRALAYNPSNTNQLTPYNLGYLFGVTPYPLPGNSAILNQLYKANIGVIGTGAEGGISNAIIAGGNMLDGNDLTYWYTIDWMQIQCNLALSNAVINGANNPLNPLWYNQPGINQLQAVVAAVVQNSITFGMTAGTLTLTELDGPTLAANIANGTYTNKAVVNAVPFVDYVTDNPSDFKSGVYKGLSVIFVPSRPFTQIVLNLTASQLIAL